MNDTNKARPVSKFRKSAASWPLIGRLFDRGPKVSVVRFSGIISDMSRKPAISYAKHAKILEKAFEKTGVVAVALVINSPGGAPAQSSLIGSLIRQLAMEKSLPVYAFVEDVAASGGYWLACAADEIYAQESSIVGSIGVISGGFGFEDFIERHGIHRRLHTSGGQKSFLDPFKPEKADDVERLKLIQNDIHEGFIDWVKTRRAERLKGGEWELFDGRFWTGKGGLERGLIDGLGDIRSVMRQKYGEHITLVPFETEKKYPFPLSLLMQSSLTDDLSDTLERRALQSRYGF